MRGEGGRREGAGQRVHPLLKGVLLVVRKLFGLQRRRERWQLSAAESVGRPMLAVRSCGRRCCCCCRYRSSSTSASLRSPRLRLGGPRAMLCRLVRVDLAKVALLVADEKVEANEGLGAWGVAAVVGGQGVVIEAMAGEVVGSGEGCGRAREVGSARLRGGGKGQLDPGTRRTGRDSSTTTTIQWSVSTPPPQQHLHPSPLSPPGEVRPTPA